MLSGCIPKVETVTHLVITSVYPEPSPLLGVAPASQNLSLNTGADASPAHKQVVRNTRPAGVCLTPVRPCWLPPGLGRLTVSFELSR